MENIPSEGYSTWEKYLNCTRILITYHRLMSLKMMRFAVPFRVEYVMNITPYSKTFHPRIKWHFDPHPRCVSRLQHRATCEHLSPTTTLVLRTNGSCPFVSTLIYALSPTRIHPVSL